MKHKDQKDYRSRCIAVEEQYVEVVEALRRAHGVLLRGDDTRLLRDYISDVLEKAEAFRGKRGLKE